MTFWGFCFGLENSETRTQKRDKPTREEQKKRERIAKLLADAKPAEPQSTKRAEKQEILITKGEREEKRRRERQRERSYSINGVLLISLSLRSRHGRALKKEGSEGFFLLSISKKLKRILEF